MNGRNGRVLERPKTEGRDAKPVVERGPAVGLRP